MEEVSKSNIIRVIKLRRDGQDIQHV